MRTRRMGSPNRDTRNAERAIGNRGNHALRKLLGVRRRPKLNQAVSRPPSTRRVPRSDPKDVEIARLRAEVARLSSIVQSLKAGRAITASRAGGPSTTANNFRGINLFHREPFLIAGQPYQMPELAWAGAQRTNAQNRGRRQRGLFRR